MALRTSKVGVGNIGKNSTNCIPYCFVGATAGWAKTATVDYPMWNVPASQTSSTLIVPIPDLCVGDLLTGWTIIGGKTGTSTVLTLDVNLRSITSKSDGTYTDASIASATQVSFTNVAQAVAADWQLTAATQTRVAAGTSYYLKITVTTPAANTLNLISIDVQTKKAFGQIA